ncbi:hypothetical protein ICT70_05800 [Pelobacter sp. M08fum]|uniref:Uncharacterized protein n=1 Tax=Pelovirga terrestris TaxID=2771352 RepID=A0A8J6QP82_9BACT|nr:hypothetical protein [Pelovirga terrestris]
MWSNGPSKRDGVAKSTNDCVAAPAFAVDTAVTYNSGLLVLLFVGCCVLILVAQLVPAVLILFGRTKAAAQGTQDRCC